MSSILFRGGTLVPMDPALPAELSGDLLVEGDRIAAIGPDLTPPGPGTEVVELHGAIVTPGLVDSHRHVWQSLLRYAGVDWGIPQYGPNAFRRFAPRYEPEDSYVAIRLGLAEALDAGITQLLDWNHNLRGPEHVAAVVRAHRDSGLRVVLGYGESAAAWAGTYSAGGDDGLADYLADVESARAEHYSSGDGLLGLAMAVRGPEKSPREVVEAQWRRARELGLRLTVHVGNGPNGRRRAVAGLEEAGLLGSDTTYIHCNTLADDELGMIAASGGTVSVAPLVESSMGHGPTAIPRLAAAGIRPSLSVDTCTNAGGDLFSVMRAAASLARAELHAEALERGEWAPEPLPRVADVLAMATVEGARANGLAATTGTLSPGKQADLVVFGRDRPNLVPVADAAGAVVMGAHPGNVDTVLVAGRRLKAGGRLLDPGLGALLDEARERSARLLRD